MQQHTSIQVVNCFFKGEFNALFLPLELILLRRRAHKVQFYQCEDKLVRPHRRQLSPHLFGGARVGLQAWDTDVANVRSSFLRHGMWYVSAIADITVTVDGRACHDTWCMSHEKMDNMRFQI